MILAGDIGLADATSDTEFGTALTSAVAAGKVAYGLAGITTTRTREPLP